MTTDEKLTPWFKKGEQPWEPGVYEVNSFFDGERVYAHWDGSRWGWIEYSVFLAHLNRGRATGRPHIEVQWRGLASDPKKGGVR